MEYQSFKVAINDGVADLSFNKPKKSNSLKFEDWAEMKQVFQDLDNDDTIRVIILSGVGKNFCAGMDLNAFSAFPGQTMSCQGRKNETLRRFILDLQDTVSAIELCRKPVIAAVHGACIGGGVDIVSACDMRYCTNDAYFSIREVDIGMVADLGTLQRMPKFVNPGIVAELAYTGRNFVGTEAEKIQFVTRAYADQATLQSEVTKLAQTIAAKSPLVVRGTKEMLLYQRDHTTADSLNYIATWNASTLVSNDLMAAIHGYMTKSKPVFED